MCTSIRCLPVGKPMWLCHAAKPWTQWRCVCEGASCHKLGTHTPVIYNPHFALGLNTDTCATCRGSHPSSDMDNKAYAVVGCVDVCNGTRPGKQHASCGCPRGSPSHHHMLTSFQSLTQATQRYNQRCMLLASVTCLPGLPACLIARLPCTLAAATTACGQCLSSPHQGGCCSSQVL